MTTAIDRLDGLSTSVAVKVPCVVAATTNLTLAGEQTVAGVAVVTGDRVLAAGQTDATQRLIWVADTGPWTLAQDSDGARDLVNGTMVLAGTSTVGEWQFWLGRGATSPIVPGTTAMTWEPFNYEELALQADLANATLVGKGSAMVGHGSLLNYSRNTIGQAVQDIGRSVRSGGAVGDGTTDDTAAINACLATGGHWVLPAGYTFRITASLAMPVDYTRLSGGGQLLATFSNASWLVVTGDYCSVAPGVRLHNASPVFDGSNSRTTLAAIWVLGTVGFRCEGARITGFPRCGIGLEDSTQAEIVGNYIAGGYPYASYNEASTTGHAAIFYNPPADSSALKHALLVSGNLIGQSIQGLLYGNFDSAGNTRGIVVCKNYFWDCWDHAMYCTLGEGTIIALNYAMDCRRPFVIDGEGCEVVSNVGWATGTTQTNHEQMISVRRANRARVIGNYLRGVGAGIDCSALSGDVGADVSENIVDANVLRQIAASTYLEESIRVGAFATTCRNNIVTHNRVSSVQTGGKPVLSLQCTSGTGEDNQMARNSITCTADAQPLSASNQLGASISDNSVGFSFDAGSATTIIGVQLTSTDKSYVERNRFNYRTGGTNVTIRAVQVEVGSDHNTVAGTRCDFSAASLVAKVGLLDNAGTTKQRDNVWSATDDLGGAFTLNGAASIVVSNGNVTTATRVTYTPVNNAAGACVRDKGLTVTVAAGQITFATSDGTNPAASSNFTYTIQ